MKKTYIATVPNDTDAFLKASECFTELDINITRVSYNKAVDMNTIFIDAQGDEEQLKKADTALQKIGYLKTEKQDKTVVLIEFHLKDRPGSVTGVFSLLKKYGYSIAYLSSQKSSAEHQYFKVGIVVDSEESIDDFLEEARLHGRVRIIDYNRAENVYDNSLFYDSFSLALAKTMGLSEELSNDLIVNTNLAMENLDKQGLSPFRTFDSIGKFADLLASSRGNNFIPRITDYKISENTEITLIEPPCGANTAIIKSEGKYLFVDCGYALYKEEMLRIFRNIIPDFDRIHKTAFITHADLDHCGIVSVFDEVLCTEKSAECLKLEYNGENGFRESNPLHKPYVKICKLLTFYKPPEPHKVKGIWERHNDDTAPISQVGNYSFGELCFEVYEGKGGHLPGEAVLIDYEHHIAFTGDIYINLHDQTKEQHEYNQYAPILTTTVDTLPELAATERKNVLQRLGTGDWLIFGGHGAVKKYSVKSV